MSNGLPTEDLQLKAADERLRLHRSVEELRACLHERLDIKKNTRDHIVMACGIAAVVGLTAGYSFAGIFVNH